MNEYIITEMETDDDGNYTYEDTYRYRLTHDVFGRGDRNSYTLRNNRNEIIIQAVDTDDGIMFDMKGLNITSYDTDRNIELPYCSVQDLYILISAMTRIDQMLMPIHKLEKVEHVGDF